MPSLGAPELILIIVIILLLFGAGRATEVFRALGSGIREFRDAAGGDNKEDADKDAGEEKPQE
ncbi:MAG: twin-arginine translocase TatA/TatE family subunit [Chloroflexi bacterium]|nr:twin-arginine translocase TatA/TatE family subunit [Chloroflexota bacterium]